MSLIKSDKIGKEVWFSCRATQGCPGKYAIVKRMFKLASGGKSIHYQCTTCKRGFVISL